MIMERNFAPVIVFSFSKKDCEAYAMQMSKLDFNTDEEKDMVQEVFNNAIDTLSDDDKKLPQVSYTSVIFSYVIWNIFVLNHVVCLCWFLFVKELAVIMLWMLSL